MPVRVGYPHGIEGLADVVRNPIYATSAGLLLYGVSHQGRVHENRGHSGESGAVSRFVQWLRESF